LLSVPQCRIENPYHACHVVTSFVVYTLPRAGQNVLSARPQQATRRGVHYLVRRAVERRENAAESHFHKPKNTKASIPRVRDEGFTHSVVPPWFGDGRLLLPFIALHSARDVGKTESVTLGSRIRLRGEFRAQRAGFHHPPALSIPSKARTIPRRSR